MAGAALVTGGAKRIGRAISLALARKGYDLAVHYHTSAAEAEELATEIRALGRQCELLECDLADREAVAGLMERVLAALPHCDVLVNNASIFPAGDFLGSDDALLDRVFEVNFRAPLSLCRQFAAGRQRGQIINLLDTQITRPFTSHFAYSLSKKALASLTRMAARALAPDIRVNGVCPGLIVPPAGADAAEMDSLAARVPMKRTGSPEAVAAAVISLLEADYVTGQVLFVDGGQHLR